MVTSELEEPKMARFLRVKPIEWHGAIALRMEIYGCMRGELFILTYYLCSLYSGLAGIPSVKSLS